VISECTLNGENVRLRPVGEGDLALFVRWLNDPDVRYWLALSEAPDLTMESEREWYEEMRADAAGIVWVIETASGKPIGNVGLHGVDETNRRAALGIFIGEKDHWSDGYGTDAIRRVLGYAFGELALRLVELHTDEDNLRAIRCYEKCGFQREGLFRAHRLRLGQPVSALPMSVLREEFEVRPWR
jgi:RimJ/RimL family protein N-acetyltransferase